MKFQSITKQLKNGKAVTIRQCQVEDAEELLNLAKVYHTDSEHLLAGDEFNPTLEQEIKWIESFAKNENSLLLVATHEGKIIGNIDIRGGQLAKIKHTGYLGMAIQKEWRNQGLGTHLLECGIEWSKANPQLEILGLQVFANHAAGITLYQNMGFKECGRQKNFIKTGSGEYIDNLIMELHLK